MSGKYPDVIKCGTAFLFIINFNATSLEVTYNTIRDDRDTIIYRDGTLISNSYTSCTV